jgi:hypothetical protein
MTINTDKTLVTPKMAKHITFDFAWALTTTKEEYEASVWNDGTMLEKFGITPADLEEVDLPSRSKNTSRLKFKLDTIQYRGKKFSSDVAAGDVFLEDEIAVQTEYAERQRNLGSHFPGIIEGHEAVQEILRKYLQWQEA